MFLASCLLCLHSFFAVEFFMSCGTKKNSCYPCIDAFNIHFYYSQIHMKLITDRYNRSTNRCIKWQ